MSLVSNERPKVRSFAVAMLSSAVQGGIELSSSAAYSGGRACEESHALTPAAYASRSAIAAAESTAIDLAAARRRPSVRSCTSLGIAAAPRSSASVPARLPARLVHLEEPILRVQPADEEVGVVVRLGEDVRDPEPVADDRGRPLEPGDVDARRSARRGERAAGEDRGHGQREDDEIETRDAHQPLLFGRGAILRLLAPDRKPRRPPRRRRARNPAPVIDSRSRTL